ncbi:MAG: hypothetical protein JO242_26520, partial [Streptosporangiaceae bacterium]|nr:hypothetical protein [Streptosporangiaceae bacterium]
APLVPRSRPGPGDLPVSLVDAVREIAVPVVLVIDDVHELAGSGVLPGLDFLVHHAPPALRLILCGRSAPGLALAKMRVTGDLAELGATDLACTAEEADAYLGRAGLAVSAAERDELLRYTEGWMTGLRLVTLAAGRGGAPVTSGVGNDTIVADYLRDEVTGRLPREVQLFMRRTSVAQPLTGELADWLTGRSGGARVLDHLNRQNNLVEHVPGESGQYRYHPFLRDTLLAELRRQLPDEVPVLFGRAARWYAARGEAVEAVRCSAEAADWKYASKALAEAGIAGLLPDGAAELETVLGGFPADRRSGDPVVAAALAAARLCGADPESAAAYLDYAERAIGDCAEDTRPVIELWLAASAGTLPVHRALGLLWLALGTVLLRRWEIADARRALGHAGHQLSAAGLAGLRARACGWQVLAEAFYGDLGAADRVLAELRSGFPAEPATECFGMLASAQLALERDDLVSAARLLDEADAPAVRRLPGEPDAALVRTLIQARRALAAGDIAGAGGLVTLLRETGLDPSVLSVLDADIALRAGDVLPTGEALRAGPAGGPPDRADQILARARLLLAGGDPAAALKAADRLEGTATGMTARDHITALLVAAVANRRLGAVGAAAAFLSVNTVKTHLRSAYHKLGVTSRRAAIARGRRLQLL